MASNKRAAHGSGTIRKKTVTRNGQDYTYWEARITTGYDTGTGRQKQRSVTGKTQKEVREKLQALAVEAVSYTHLLTPSGHPHSFCGFASSPGGYGSRDFRGQIGTRTIILGPMFEKVFLYQWP